MAETADKKTPHSLQGWRERLRQPRLPIDAIIKVTALQKLHTLNGNADNVAQVIQGDPALALLLLHDANKSLQHSANKSRSLAHAIGLPELAEVPTKHLSGAGDSGDPSTGVHGHRDCGSHRNPGS